MESLGGPPTPAVGWAAGIERLGMLCALPETAKPFLFVIPDDKEDRSLAITIANLLRMSGIDAQVAFNASGKRSFELAKKSRARARLVIRRQQNASGLPSRMGHHVVMNEPSDFAPADSSYRDTILKVLEQQFVVVRHERNETGAWVDAVLQAKGAQ
jgi:histidyl-tRNA synthetase